MKKHILALCALLPIFGYTQAVFDGEIDVTPVEIDGEWGHQFVVMDTDFPPYYYNPDLYPFPEDGYPENGYSYFWHTDEGHISTEEKPVFYFSSEGMHNISLVLTPRKKGDELKTLHTFTYLIESTDYTSNETHANLIDEGMFVNGQAREGDKVYVIVPLNHCNTAVEQKYKVAYNDEQLVFSSLFSQSKLNIIDPVLDTDDDAFGISLDKEVVFKYDWTDITSFRDDVAAVIEFDVIVPEPEILIGLKFNKSKKSQCDNNKEILFRSIAGPYDPNYKESSISVINVYEEPIKKVTSTDVLYRIHFQNIGDAPVDSITIYDTLPPYLSFVSFEGSSEPSLMVSTNHTGGVLEWIIAPDADVKGTNESPSPPESTTRGWVDFRATISKEEDIIYDTCFCLANIATIYFDSLAPITTAADVIVIGDSLCFSIDQSVPSSALFAHTICDTDTSSSSTSSSSSTRLKSKTERLESSFTAYPNPSNGTLQLSGELEKITSIEVLNSLGQIVLSLPRHENSINLEEQPNGLYFIRIITAEEQHIIRVGKQE